MVYLDFLLHHWRMSINLGGCGHPGSLRYRAADTFGGSTGEQQ